MVFFLSCISHSGKSQLFYHGQLLTSKNEKKKKNRRENREGQIMRNFNSRKKKKDEICTQFNISFIFHENEIHAIPTDMKSLGTVQSMKKRDTGDASVGKLSKHAFCVVQIWPRNATSEHSEVGTGKAQSNLTSWRATWIHLETDPAGVSPLFSVPSKRNSTLFSSLFSVT